MDLTQILRRNLLLYIVQRQMFCVITGDVLDVDTCVVVLDSDGDPHAVFSPNAYRRMLDTGVSPDKFLTPGFTFDPATLPVLD